MLIAGSFVSRADFSSKLLKMLKSTYQNGASSFLKLYLYLLEVVVG
jgi:hypothetical protein